MKSIVTGTIRYVAFPPEDGRHTLNHHFHWVLSLDGTVVQEGWAASENAAEMALKGAGAQLRKQVDFKKRDFDF